MSRKPIRRHGAAPSNWQYRDGRPAWIPSPTLRKAGWKRLDFKDPVTGAYMSEGASIDAARLVNAAVEAWKRGEVVPAAYAAIAPAGAAASPSSPYLAPLERYAIGRLLDECFGVPDRTAASGWKVEPCNEIARLKPKTQADYRNKAKRLVDVLAGYLELPDREDVTAMAAYAEAVAEIRADSVFALQPVETKDGIEDPLYTAYWNMRRDVGHHQANGVLAVASVWLSWCRARKSRSIHNWAADVDRETPDGRIRVGTWAEISALITAAEELGWASIADSIILGLDLSWNQVDRFALTWAKVVDDRCFTAREKTGRVGGTPLLARLGGARLKTIRERQEKMDAHPTHVLWCETTGAPWKPDHYRHVFAEVRALAAQRVPSVADFRDADLRDTAFSWGRNAGLNDDMTASRTLQSRKHIAQLGDRAYGEIGAEIADQGAALLDAYLERMGVAV